MTILKKNNKFEIIEIFSDFEKKKNRSMIFNNLV